MRVNPDQGLQFAQMLVQDEEPLANINQVMHKSAHAAGPYNMFPFLRAASLPSRTHSSTKCPVWEPPSVLFQMCQQCKEFTKSVTPPLPF